MPTVEQLRKGELRSRTRSLAAPLAGPTPLQSPVLWPDQPSARWARADAAELAGDEVN